MRLSGPDGADAVLVVSIGTRLSVFGLGAQIDIFDFDAALDKLVINGLAATT